MKKIARILISLVLATLLFPLRTMAQEPIKGGLRDSVQLQSEMQMVQPSTEFSEEAIELPSPTLPDTAKKSLPFTLTPTLFLPYPTLPLSGDYSTQGILSASSRSLLYGAGSQTTLPGIGMINEASLGWQYALSPTLTFQADVAAMKFNAPFSVGQNLGASGMLTYQLSDRVSLRAFGSYYLGPTFGMSSHRYGATVLLGLSDRFSLEAGVQRRYNPLRGRWETVPVLMPSYQFNRINMSVDVGGILYELLNSSLIRKDLDFSNPTIAPPTSPLHVR